MVHLFQKYQNWGFFKGLSRWIELFVLPLLQKDEMRKVGDLRWLFQSSSSACCSSPPCVKSQPNLRRHFAIDSRFFILCSAYVQCNSFKFMLSTAAINIITWMFWGKSCRLGFLLGFKIVGWLSWVGLVHVIVLMLQFPEIYSSGEG